MSLIEVHTPTMGLKIADRERTWTEQWDGTEYLRGTCIMTRRWLAEKQVSIRDDTTETLARAWTRECWQRMLGRDDDREGPGTSRSRIR